MNAQRMIRSEFGPTAEGRPLFRRPPMVVFTSILLLAAMVTWLSACASSKPPQDIPEAEVKRPPSPEVLEYQAEFSEHNPEIVTRCGKTTITVRMATRNELPEDLSKVAGFLSAEGAGSVALGLTVPTIFSSALIVGGVILVPGGAWIYHHEKKVWKAVGDAMSRTRLTKAIADAVKKRLRKRYPDGRTPELEVEIRVEAFGLVDSRNRFLDCLVLSAACVIGRNGVKISQETLKITEDNRSPDAPPPQCATADHYAEHNARLLKEHLAEAAVVVAAMAVQRLPEAEEP